MLSIPLPARLAALLPAITLSACTTMSAPESAGVHIRWTAHDMPHIQADNYQGLGFGYGYVLARDRLCEAAGRTIALRGERSRYYGPDGLATVGFLKTTNLNSDLAIKLRLPDDWVQSELRGLQPNTREYIRGVTAGMNHYVAQLPADERQGACGEEPVPEFRDTDIVRSAMRFGVMKELVDVGPALVASASLWTPVPLAASSVHARPVRVEGGFGSNAWVYGGDVVAGEGALMLANPHSAWERRPHMQRIYMHQAHLTIPGELDVAGATFLGIPLPLSGYNADVAWTILDAATVSPFVLQAMDVQTSGTAPTYRMDGETRALERRPVTVAVRQADGQVVPRTFEFAHSELGVLYKLPEAPGRPAGWYAITNAGERNASGLDQFLAVARAASTRDAMAAVAAHRGILSQLLVADRHGDVGYVVAGNVLPVDDSAMRACHLASDANRSFKTVDGSRSACAFRDSDGQPLLAPPDFYPDLVSRSIIHNTNNSYKYSEYGKTQAAYPAVFGLHFAKSTAGQTLAAGLRYDPRLVMSARRMGEVSADGVVTPDEASQVVFDNRNYAAETFLDDILALCTPTDPAALKTGCTTLANWDRRNNRNSRGALLFHQFWNRVVRQGGFLPANPTGNPEVRERLLISPDNAPQLTAALTDAVQELHALGFAADEPWGNVLYATADGTRIALHGGSYQEGVLNGEMPMPLTREGFPFILFGTVYLQRIQWPGGELVADVLLSHGQREDVDSPGRSAQLKLFSNKQLYRPPFSPQSLTSAEIIESRRF
ncbi:penicillin acylase family protein [Parahaliea mediterranea]|uniref:penicillin acylase family protein n=1 Tax=Parahaliea mediterranea TaxID=651086 RepID=UPI0019D41369|nr:penicillin acylase family protein [Parahaliea mediterranea]